MGGGRGWMESINTAIFIQLQLCQWLWSGRGWRRGLPASTPRVGRILRRAAQQWKTTQFSLSVLVFSSITERGRRHRPSLSRRGLPVILRASSGQSFVRRFVPTGDVLREASLYRRDSDPRRSTQLWLIIISSSDYEVKGCVGVLLLQSVRVVHSHSPGGAPITHKCGNSSSSRRAHCV